LRKYAREWVQSYPSIAKIHEAIAGVRRMGSEGTVETYIKGIKVFVEYLGFSDPETALQSIRKGEVNAEEKVDTFIDYALVEQAKAHNHVRNHVFGIKKWFELNGVKVDWNKIELPTSAEIQEEDRAPTKDDLKKLLNHGTARDRTIIFCDSSSGLRIGTLLSLKKGDLDTNYPDVARLTVQRKRGRKFTANKRGTSGRLFCTFITPEAKNSLLQYFEERKAAGEILTDESPLIGDNYHKGKFTSTEDYEKCWARLLKRAGLAKKSNKWYELHIHTLRKYFRSNCIGIDASYRERWMGHKGLYLDISYFRAEEQQHLTEYKKAVPYLTIQEVPTDQKKLQNQMLVAFAKLQGYDDEKIKRLSEVLQRSKDLDEGIGEFKRLEDDDKPPADNAHLSKKLQRSPLTCSGKYSVAKGENELVRRLDDGWNLVKSLSEDKYLLERF
jgi:integrase